MCSARFVVQLRAMAGFRVGSSSASVQFLYTDARVPPIGGQRRMTHHKDVLDAVTWQNEMIRKAEEMDSWASRLDSTRRLDKGGMAGHNEARRIEEDQRWRDIGIRQTGHGLTGTVMFSESCTRTARLALPPRSHASHTARPLARTNLL